jgi:hypothetical protein
MLLHMKKNSHGEFEGAFRACTQEGSRSYRQQDAGMR